MSEKKKQLKKEKTMGKERKQLQGNRKERKVGLKERKEKKYVPFTFSEKQRLKQLRQILSGHTHKKEQPTTAQKTIPFQTMEKDGVCQVNSHFFTKMIEFYDINYELLDVREQKEILNSYSQFLNYFDPSIHVQLFLFNRQVDENILTKQISVAAQGDDFDDIRTEFSSMLRNQMAKGNNGIIKSKYLIFGAEAQNLKEARTKLSGIEKDICKNLRAVGTRVRLLDGEERLQVLHEYFHQDTMESFRFSWQELADSGSQIKDYVAPTGFDFRDSCQVRIGTMYSCISYIDILAPMFQDTLLKGILDIDDNVTVSMHMQTIDPIKAMKMLKGTLSDIQKMKIEEQKKAFRNGYDMDIIPPDIVTYEKETLEMLEDLNTSNQKMIRMTFLIACSGRTKRDLENITQRISGIVQQANCNLRCLQYLQEQGLMASAPLGINELESYF